MEIITGSENIIGRLSYSLVTIGNFDGVHVGHQSIFRQMAQTARKKNGTAVVFTFEPHPVKILAPEKNIHLLTSFKNKMQRIAECGIDQVVCEKFDRQLADMPARDFVKILLVDRLQAREIWVGSEFVFGRNRQGTVSSLKQMGEQSGFIVHIIDPIKAKGEVVSSSRIRALLVAGKVEEAAELLGRPYSLTGPVIKGHQTGNANGFPTANIKTDVNMLPAKGVYAAQIFLDGATHHGVVNIGINPTFNRNQLSVETHILDFNQSIYGKEIEVNFIRRIRSEIAFPSADALARQIRKDIQNARAIFAENQ